MRRVLLFVVVLLTLASTSWAEVNPVQILLNSPLNATPGEKVTFTGSIVNNGGPISIYGCYFTSIPPELSPWPTDEFSKPWPSLAAGETWTGSFFDVTVKDWATPGTYGGTFGIMILDASGQSCPSASTRYDVIVGCGQEVPEASTVALGLLGMSSLGAWLKLRKK